MKLIVFLGAGVLAQDQTTANFDETTTATTQSTILEVREDSGQGNQTILLRSLIKLILVRLRLLQRQLIGSTWARWPIAIIK